MVNNFSVLYQAHEVLVMENWELFIKSIFMENDKYLFTIYFIWSIVKKENLFNIFLRSS